MLNSHEQRRLKGALRHGLPHTHRPWADLASQLGLTETQVLHQVNDWLNDGTIKRMGLVVNHHALGYTANAMVVFNIPDAQVDQVAAGIVKTGQVSLCYRRPRRPNWPYNLFCMFHGRSRTQVMMRLKHVIAQCALHDVPHEVLFSTRQFKQCGGHYGLTLDRNGERHDHLA